MYTECLIVILFLSLFAFDYQKSNNCEFQMTVQMSFSYNISPLVNITQKKVHRPTSQKMLIPQLIIQTHQNDQVPAQLLNTIELILHLNPTYSYQFYNSTDRRQFLKQYLPQKVLKAYDKIIPKAFKADLWRYSTIYHKGGCYMDTGSYTVKPLSKVLLPNDTFVSTIDASGWGVNSAFFCAEPHHPILKHNIDDIVEWVEKQEYGDTALSVTGPHRFQNSFIKYFQLPFGKPLEAIDYGNGVRLFAREIEIGCLIARLVDIRTNQTFVLSKYPGYYADQKQYVNEPRYGDYWKSRKMYKKD